MTYDGTFRVHVPNIKALFDAGCTPAQIAANLTGYNPPSESVVNYILKREGLRMPRRRKGAPRRPVHRSTNWVHATQYSVWAETEAAYC